MSTPALPLQDLSEALAGIVLRAAPSVVAVRCARAQSSGFVWRPGLIVTSPLPRASQTAEIAAERLKIKCREDKLLAPGFSREALERLLKKYPEESLMIVGHEPDFTGVISELTGATLKLSKAGTA